MSMKALCYLPHLELRLQRDLKHALNSTRLKSKFFEDPVEFQTEFKAFCENGQSTILVCEPDFARQIEDIQLPSKTLKVIVLNERLTRLPIDLRKGLSADAFVALQNGRFDISELMLMFRKYLDGDIFGLDHYVQSHTIAETRMIDSTESKEQAIRELMRTIQRLGNGMDQHRFLDFNKVIPMLVDELVLNGVYNANPRFLNKKPEGHFHLEPAEALEVEWRFDGRYFGVRVADPFGTFDREVALNYLMGLCKGASKRSLGLGIRLSYEQLDRLVINVEKGRRTEVVGLVELVGTAPSRVSKPKSFHFFQI